MSFADLDFISVLLRVLTYAGTISVAGGALIRTTMGAVVTAKLVHRQIVLGALLLIVCEPLRYGHFQLSIAQGDMALAFDPSMRWLGVETPLGQAALLRLASLGLVLLGVYLAHAATAATGALLMIAAYLIEGHTASALSRSILGPALFLHLLVAHWWIGALFPIRALLASSHVSDEAACKTVNQFGHQAIVAVGLLTAAGVVMFAILIEWRLQFASVYQQGLFLKFGTFLAILFIAAVNKFRLTPLLSERPELGRRLLRRAISVEIAIACIVMLFTAIATSFSPEPH